MSRRFHFAALPFLALAAYACSSTPTTNTSTLRGTLAKEGYPSAPLAIVAVDEAKKETTAAIAADGSFALVLAKDHHYSIHAKLDTGEVPVVFPRADGTLDVGISIKSGAASFDMGAVRYVATAPDQGFTLMSAPPTTGGSCVSGMDSATGAACVQTTAAVSCQYGPEEQDDDGDDGEGDGECENGVDANTGAACTDDDAALQAADVPADAAKPMAVPEKSVPDEVGGCDDGDDEEDDDAETNDD